MGKTVHRSASTGRFVKTSTAKRNPRTTKRTKPQPRRIPDARHKRPFVPGR